MQEKQPAWVDLTVAQAAKLLKVSEQHMYNIAPIMMEGGYAWRVRASWVFHPQMTPQWGAFMDDRRRLVKKKIWTRTRKHSVQDFEDWINGDLDDLIDGEK